MRLLIFSEWNTCLMLEFSFGILWGFSIVNHEYVAIGWIKSETVIHRKNIILYTMCVYRHTTRYGNVRSKHAIAVASNKKKQFFFLSLLHAVQTYETLFIPCRYRAWLMLLWLCCQFTACRPLAKYCALILCIRDWVCWTGSNRIFSAFFCLASVCSVFECNFRNSFHSNIFFSLVDRCSPLEHTRYLNGMEQHRGTATAHVIILLFAVYFAHRALSLSISTRMTINNLPIHHFARRKTKKFFFNGSSDSTKKNPCLCQFTQILLTVTEYVTDSCNWSLSLSLSLSNISLAKMNTCRSQFFNDCRWQLTATHHSIFRMRDDERHQKMRRKIECFCTNKCCLLWNKWMCHCGHGHTCCYCARACVCVCGWINSIHLIFFLLFDSNECFLHLLRTASLNLSASLSLSRSLRILNFYSELWLGTNARHNNMTQFVFFFPFL